MYDVNIGLIFLLWEYIKNQEGIVSGQELGQLSLKE